MPPSVPSTTESEPAGADSLFRTVYDELRRLSETQLGAERGAITLSATGLVHEAYFKLRGSDAWTDRAHFLAIAARAMRQVLTERARARTALKRGAGASPVTLVAGHLAEDDPRLADDVLAIDRAIDRLADHDAALARLVELRFFAGLEVAEAAEATGVSPRTAARQWVRAKAFLLRTLRAA